MKIASFRMSHSVVSHWCSIELHFKFSILPELRSCDIKLLKLLTYIVLDLNYVNKTFDTNLSSV